MVKISLLFVSVWETNSPRVEFEAEMTNEIILFTNKRTACDSLYSYIYIDFKECLWNFCVENKFREEEHDSQKAIDSEEFFCYKR